MIEVLPLNAYWTVENTLHVVAAIDNPEDSRITYFHRDRRVSLKEILELEAEPPAGTFTFLETIEVMCHALELDGVLFGCRSMGLAAHLHPSYISLDAVERGADADRARRSART